MDTANGLQRGKDIFAKIVGQVNLEGKNPRSSGAFRIIQQHALDHPSMEFSVDESLENALAGDLNDSEDFRRLGRWTEGVCKNTKYDRGRLQNVLQNDSTMREYRAEFTKLPLNNEHLTCTDMSSLCVPGTSRAQLDAVARSATNGATKCPTSSTPVRAETLRTPAEIIRQNQILNFGRRASDAQRAMPPTSNPIVLIDDDNDDDQQNQGFLTFAQRKSDVTKKTANVFAPATFSTPTQGKRAQTSHLLTNSAVVGPSISPVLRDEETPATASVPSQDVQTTNHLPTQPLSSIAPQVASKSTTKQSRIPQWARDSARKTTALSTANEIRLPSLGAATPKSSLVPAVNPTPKPLPTIENVDKTPAPTVTFNLVVNNTPMASQAPQNAQTSQTLQPNPVQTNAIPVNSNRVSSTITSNKSATNDPSNEVLLTDDDDEDETETDAAKRPQTWKTVANRHPTPGVPTTANRRSGIAESNKSLRRQLFRPIHDNNDQMRSPEPEPERIEDDAVADAGGECVVITVRSQTSRCASARNLYETHSVAIERSATDRPISETFDKESASLRNFTYDVVNPTGGSQPAQNASEQNARTTEAEEPEPSGMPSDAVLDSIDSDSAHGAVAMDGADSSGDSSVGSSSTLHNLENIPKIVNAQSPHADHEKSQRAVLAPMTASNRHSVRLPSFNIATSTTKPIRESETFTGVLPPAHFQDDPIITEHSPTIVRESILQIISSQKNKSPIPLSLPNRLRPRRKNKSKPSEANRFDNLTDDGEPTSVGRNGRRTLYTKGNSDCEDNDAVSNAAQSLNAQPSTSNAAQRESNLTEPQNPQINANPSDSTSENPSKNISFENNSVLANSTMRTATEPAMTTMADNRPNDLSDIIEEVPVAISTERVTGTTEKVNPKRSQKAAKSNAKTKAVPKRTQRVRNVKETAVNTSNETAETVCVRRSRRARTANAWATHGPIGVYEWACQKASSAKRRPSPARTMDPEPEPDGESRVTTSKRRRIADKAKQTTKARADTREDTEVAVDSKSTNKKQQKKQTPATKQTALSHRNNLCQIAKDLGWFNDLCNTKALPTLVSQEGLYKIHMNQVGTVKIESTSYGQIHYFSDGKIDYGYFPGVIRTVGIMRFYKGGAKGTSQTETAMELEILHGTFEVWQGRKSIKAGPGVIFIQPGTTYRLKYLGSSVGVVFFHLYENE